MLKTPQKVTYKNVLKESKINLSTQKNTFKQVRLHTVYLV